MAAAEIVVVRGVEEDLSSQGNGKASATAGAAVVGCVGDEAARRVRRAGSSRSSTRAELDTVLQQQQAAAAAAEEGVGAEDVATGPSWLCALSGRRRREHYRRKKVSQFYVKQNAIIEAFLRIGAGQDAVEEEKRQPGEEGETDVEEGKNSTASPRQSKRDYANAVDTLIWLSFSANMALLALKVVATIVSGSVTMLASTIDSFLDVSSGLVLYASSRFMTSERDPNAIYRYPEGKSRTEPIAIVVFCSLMSMASLQVIVEATSRLAAGTSAADVNVDILVLVILAATVVVKLLLAVSCGYVARRTRSETLQVYEQDHRNDVVSNVVGAVAVLTAAEWVYWIDPAVAIALSCFLMWSWFATAGEAINQLLGVSANPEFLSKLTYMALTHHELILEVDTVRAYHLGPRYLVEVHIVLDPGLDLRTAHDVGESLEIAIEKLEDVERAFVHLDWSSAHTPEHKPPDS